METYESDNYLVGSIEGTRIIGRVVLWVEKRSLLQVNCEDHCQVGPPKTGLKIAVPTVIRNRKH